MEKILTKIEERRQELGTALLNTGASREFYRWLKTELAYTSNAIEGSTLTRKETALVIEEGLTSGSKRLAEYLEAQNHARAFEFVLDCLANRAEVSEDLILNIHKRILDGIDPANAGAYRALRVHITGSKTILPNPLKVPVLMENFVKELRGSKQTKVEKAIEAHYNLVTIHPFSDGNGRAARLLMNFMLLREGYGPLIIRPRDRKRYLDILEERQVRGNQESYQKFMLRSLSRSMDTVCRLLHRAEPERQKELLKIGEFSKLVGRAPSAIRHYVKEGLLEPVARTGADYMLFSLEQQDEVKRISSQNNPLWPPPRTTSEEVKKIAQEIDGKVKTTASQDKEEKSKDHNPDVELPEA